MTVTTESCWTSWSFDSTIFSGRRNRLAYSLQKECTKFLLQLSYSILQDDYNLIECLRTFSDTVRKTDARIPLAIVSEDDYRWLGQLVALFQMVWQFLNAPSFPPKGGKENERGTMFGRKVYAVTIRVANKCLIGCQICSAGRYFSVENAQSHFSGSVERRENGCPLVH